MKLGKLLIISSLLVFSGCTTLQKATEGLSTEDPELLFKAGQHTEAARIFIQQAEQSSGSLQTYNRLRAAAALARADQISQAKQLLNQTPYDPRDPSINNISR